MLNRKLLISVILFSVPFFAHCELNGAEVAATVGNKQISLKNFLERYEDYLVWTGVQDNVQARFAVLNNMVNEILLRTYDDNSNIYTNPEYKKEISSAWKETVLAFLKDREVYANIKVSDDEMREAYQRSKIKIAVRHLYARTEKEAENLYKLVTMGVSFHELAKQVFTDTMLANNGGYLGYITWGDTDPNFEKAAYSLKVGEVSKPVKTAQGYSIIRVDDRIENPFTTEDDFVHQKQKIERALKIEKKASYEQAYLDKVFDKNKVKFNEKAIASVFDDVSGSHSENIEPMSKRRFFATCAQYKNTVYSQKEIENKLLEVPAYNRELLTSIKRVKEAIVGLMMQDVLLKIAKEKGYDTTSYVKNTYTKLENDIYLRYKRDEILKTVPVSDSEIVHYYNAHIAYYSTEKEMNVQEIIVNNDSLASSLKNSIEHGKDFGELAEKYSLRKWSAVHKGIMGLAPVSKFGELKDTLWNAQEGKVVGPFKFDQYYGVFRVLTKENGHPLDINLVRSQIVTAIKNIKGFSYMKKHLERLSELTSVKVNDDLVRNYNIKITSLAN